MPNIVYVLTNPVMPGIVKIGMTDRPDVRHRMADLYTTGVPLPFDCVVARELENITAAEVESALHTAFGPNRVNPSREFFEVEPEQVEAVLRLMQGRDVTPEDTGQSTDPQPDDREVSAQFKRRKSRTNEVEFLESLNDNGESCLRESAGTWQAGQNENQMGSQGILAQRGLQRRPRRSLPRLSAVGVQPKHLHRLRLVGQKLEHSTGRPRRTQDRRAKFRTVRTYGYTKQPCVSDRS